MTTQTEQVVWLSDLTADTEMGLVPAKVAEQARRFDEALRVLPRFENAGEGQFPRLARLGCDFGIQGNELVAKVPGEPVVVMREVLGRVHLDANHPLLRPTQVEGEWQVLAGLCGLAPDVAIEEMSSTPVKHEGRNVLYESQVQVTLGGRRIPATLQVPHGNSASDMGLYDATGTMLLEAVTWPGEPTHFTVGGVYSHRG